ncbi:MAG: DNA (cytosine-5-)-methyltransferase [Nanoarchaeota archaeon]|nr:DNA (cytosine-5-)-methyltransferase [Nanoarchaeota archaeon]
MKYFSMFSGIGGFELGINYYYKQQTYKRESLQHERNISSTSSQHRWDKQSKCIGYSEIDKYAIQIYEKRFKGHKNYGNCKEIKWNEVEDFDLLVGGVPCQAWSIAGNRKGFEDSRGTMWFEYFRCLKEKQPKLFVAENVKGILSHNKGKSFEEICRCFCELGYAIDFEVLNSKNFGVPQNRQRVFIIGVRLDLLDTSQIF